jgi:uncharacterized protein (UPF0548 family)
VSSSECVAVAVLYPWRWLSIAIWVAVLIVVLWGIWRDKQICRDLAVLEDDLAGICERTGRFDEAAQCLRHAAQMRRRAWPLRVPASPEPGPVLAKPGEPR